MRDKIDVINGANKGVKEKMYILEGRLDEIEPIVADVESKIKKDQSKGKGDIQAFKGRLEVLEDSLEQWK